jgi:hypothetical protein
MKQKEDPVARIGLGLAQDRNHQTEIEVLEEVQRLTQGLRLTNPRMMP